MPVRFHLIANFGSNQLVILSEAELARFFDNRDPHEWSAPVIITS